MTSPAPSLRETLQLVDVCLTYEPPRPGQVCPPDERRQWRLAFDRLGDRLREPSLNPIDEIVHVLIRTLFLAANASDALRRMSFKTAAMLMRTELERCDHD